MTDGARGLVRGDPDGRLLAPVGDAAHQACRNRHPDGWPTVPGRTLITDRLPRRRPDGARPCPVVADDRCVRGQVSHRPAEPPHRDPLARLHDEVASRLRGVCPDIPPDRFEALVREIVRVRVKYDPPSDDLW